MISKSLIWQRSQMEKQQQLSLNSTDDEEEGVALSLPTKTLYLINVDQPNHDREHIIENVTCHSCSHGHILFTRRDNPGELCMIRNTWSSSSSTAEPQCMETGIKIKSIFTSKNVFAVHVVLIDIHDHVYIAKRKLHLQSGIRNFKFKKYFDTKMRDAVVAERCVVFVDFTGQVYVWSYEKKLEMLEDVRTRHLPESIKIFADQNLHITRYFASSNTMITGLNAKYGDALRRSMRDNQVQYLINEKYIEKVEFCPDGYIAMRKKEKNHFYDSRGELERVTYETKLFGYGTNWSGVFGNVRLLKYYDAATWRVTPSYYTLNGTQIFEDCPPILDFTIRLDNVFVLTADRMIMHSKEVNYKYQMVNFQNFANRSVSHLDSTGTFIVVY